MHDDRDHVISVVLNHEEWQEFLKLQPQPVDWLRERIQETITASRPQDSVSPAPVKRSDRSLAEKKKGRAAPATRPFVFARPARAYFVFGCGFSE